MARIRNRMILGGSIAIGMALVLAAPVYDRLTLSPKVPVSNLTQSVSVSEQLTLDQVPRLKAQGFATIIDLRPDGEALGQPTAAAVEAVANANHMQFAYVPVPHGEIPDAAVLALQKALDDNRQPVLLYCRSGRRAARTWSLVEASREHGADARAILAAVKHSGQSADDLSNQIGQRIAARVHHTEETK